MVPQHIVICSRDERSRFEQTALQLPQLFLSAAAGMRNERLNCDTPVDGGLERLLQGGEITAKHGDRDALLRRGDRLHERLDTVIGLNNKLHRRAIIDVVRAVAEGVRWSTTETAKRRTED